MTNLLQHSVIAVTLIDLWRRTGDLKDGTPILLPLLPIQFQAISTIQLHQPIHISTIPMCNQCFLVVILAVKEMELQVSFAYKMVKMCTDMMDTSTAEYTLTNLITSRLHRLTLLTTFRLEKKKHM